MRTHTMTPEALRHNLTLQKIWLGGNQIGDVGATALAEASEQIFIICMIIYTLRCLVFNKPLISLQMFDVIAYLAWETRPDPWSESQVG